MTTIDEHKRIVKEFEEDIAEKVRRDIIAQRQKIIGFAASEGSVNCFAILLHVQNMISDGFNVNHRWFASMRRSEEKFPFDFPEKHKILSMLVRQEQLRALLCYGKGKSVEDVKEAIKIFFGLKRIVEDKIGEDL